MAIYININMLANIYRPQTKEMVRKRTKIIVYMVLSNSIWVSPDF